MPELDAEDAKLVTLARAARARIGALEGAAVRDQDGRTYASASVALPSLSLTALQLAVANAVASGATRLEAAAVVTEGSTLDDGAWRRYARSPPKRPSSSPRRTAPSSRPPTARGLVTDQNVDPTEPTSTGPVPARPLPAGPLVTAPSDPADGTVAEAVDPPPPQVYRAGFACFVGRPNAGKSTLTNAMVGPKIAITSSKPQTTRHAIRGVVNRPDGQLILVDTPGLHRPRTLLGERLNDLVRQTWSEVDVIGLCIPADEDVGRGDRFIAAELSQLKATVIAVVTKTDLVERERLAAQLLAVSQARRSSPRWYRSARSPANRSNCSPR